MIKIVICDDCIEELLAMEEKVNLYIDAHPNMDFKVAKYPMSLELMKDIKKGVEADIYFLDMFMPQKTGIEIGAAIRETNTKSNIIYTTSSKDFALEAFELKADRYLIKPIKNIEFREAMDHCIKLIAANKEVLWPVKTGGGLVTLPMSKIVYIECIKRRASYHMEDGKVIESVLMRTSFEDDIKEILNDKNFVHVHKSYVVNMEHISVISGENMEMTGNHIVPIAKRSASAIKKKYLEYLS